MTWESYFGFPKLFFKGRLLIPHSPAGADKSKGLGGRRREDEENEKKEVEERSKRREHLAHLLFFHLAHRVFICRMLARIPTA